MLAVLLWLTSRKLFLWWAGLGSSKEQSEYSSLCIGDFCITLYVLLQLRKVFHIFVSISHSTVVIYNYHEGLGFSALKSHPQTSQMFTLWQQGSIGEVQPIVFRSTLNLCTKLL